MFEYVLPTLGSAASQWEGAAKPGDKKKPEGEKKPDDKKGKEGPVRTQMIGEKPGDDLGYDPNKIPVEPIE
jgi:hypothetical protein